MSIDLSNYVTVDERIEQAKQAYPEGRFTSEIVSLPDAFAGQFVAVKAKFYRTADDPTPGEGLAWEPVPGKTPYTRDSELMNAETSAWGRALIAAFVADAKKGIASADEVRNRQTQSQGPTCPKCGGATFDNTETNEQRVLEGKKPMPAFKCRDKACGWIDWDGTSVLEKETPEFDVAAWAANAVQIFSEWDDDRRRAEWKEAIGDLYSGEQPKDQDEADRVIEAMSKTYYAEHPASDERPF